ncbi:MAG TPA: ABC transporter ATP-binding protein [Polyangiaceae bacterium]
MSGAAARSEPARAPHDGARVLPPRLSARGVSKYFDGRCVLDDVSFELEPATVHALLGENGAGKSTLVKCIMGFYRPDAGEILVGDTKARIASPRAAQRQGIGMVYQHFTLVENMTVAENLVLARVDVPRIIDWNAERRRIAAFMDEMPFRVPVERHVRQLAAGEKQKLEILKQLYLGSRIIILDEPTSVLTPQEADDVLGMLAEMAHAAQVSIVLITHKFREVQRFADAVTVLRRGQYAGSGKASELDPKTLARMMVGSEPPSVSLERTEIDAVQPLLEIEALEANDDLGLPVVKQLSLRVCAGEIVGVAGVSGNGQDELVEVLAGQRRARAGQMRVAGRTYAADRASIRRERVRLLPEAPLKNACVAGMSVAENLAFRCFDEPPFSAFGWFVRTARLEQRAQDVISEYNVKTPSTGAPIGELSGGNVQRAVLGRELSDAPAVLIAANPCFGLDFAAVREIRARIVQARNAGAAVLLVSADLDEIFALSDRILVMSEGRISHETPAASANIEEIGRHMAGHVE